MKIDILGASQRIIIIIFLASIMANMFGVRSELRIIREKLEAKP